MRDIIAHTVQLNNGENGVHLDDAGMILTDDLRHLRRLFQRRSLYLVKGYLVLLDFVIGTIMSLQYIHLLGILLNDFLDGVLIRPGSNSILVYTLNGRSGHIKAFDIDLPAGKHRRHLIEKTGNVLRMADNGL